MKPARIRILLIETMGSLSTAVENVLYTPSALKIFDTVSVPNLRTAFQEIEKDHLDLILLEMDSATDPNFESLTRLHQHDHKVPIVALLAGPPQPSALKVLQAGAQTYLLENQITEDTLSAFLLRTIERAVAQKAVRESEQRFRLLIENVTDVIMTLDVTGVITFASPSAERVLGLKPDDLLQRNILDLLHRDDRSNFLENFEKAFLTNEFPFVSFRFRRPDDNFRHMEARGRVVIDAEGLRVCILNAYDVSHRVKLEEELKRMALRDELTGLYNRRYFVSAFDQQMKIAQRLGKTGFNVLFIDLDGFKWINDNLGHKEGDRVLVYAAQLLKATFREADVIARLGGDEFVILLTGDEGPEMQVEMLRKRLLFAVERWNLKEERPYRLAMSVGVVHHDFSTRKSVEDLLKEADERMYEQKRGKKRGSPPSEARSSSSS